jgi:carboxyl-terminal processing protease
LLLKAYIARNIWGEKGFHPIAHQVDEAFQQALLLFDEAEALVKETAVEDE